MINKRVIGSITIKNGLAVQSFGYKNYLPMGKPEIIAENLDRWGVDEILINCVDRGENGPDVSLISKIAQSGVTTPLIYSGGIATKNDAIEVISKGADRVVIDSILHKNKNVAREISEFVGCQALIAAIPITVKGKSLFWYNYKDKENIEFSQELINTISNNLISELILIDWEREGSLKESFRKEILTFNPFKKINFILFGGINSPKTANNLIKMKNVSAIAVGNYFSYKEHAVQTYKKSISGSFIRKENYEYLKIGYTYYDFED